VFSLLITLAIAALDHCCCISCAGRRLCIRYAAAGKRSARAAPALRFALTPASREAKTASCVFLEAVIPV
jgi:hypothetical protein